ncbi:MAG: glycoside hydrolase family 99-like domain-containing protein [Luteibacter sp.]
MSVNDQLRTLLFRALRLGFRLTPMPTTTRDRLRQRFLERHSDLVPEGPRGRVSEGHTHRPLDQSNHRAIDYLPRLHTDPLRDSPAAVVAFYLPQFHPIPENDAWWGPGFTEWRNVARALPQFEGHLQPRLPGDLGFYDLRVPDTMHAQADLARTYGVSAFCTYFYWFAGKTLLEDPLRAWLADAKLDMPICLCWANENWSRRWDGRSDHVLIGQDHSPADDLAFIAYVADYLRDPRYLRVEEKPMLLVYRPGLLPDARATASLWRTWCLENGIGDIHLAYVQSFDNVDPRDIGFDAAVSFPPNNTSLAPVTAHRTLLNPAYSGQILDWRELAAAAPEPAYRLYPAVNPGWDNEARRTGRGRAYVHASPAGYSAWLRDAVATARRRIPAAPMVFVNAWNEWAEGAVLEPDAFRGHAWLEATRAALITHQSHPSPCAVVHAWHVDLLPEIVDVLRGTGIAWRVIVTTAHERESEVRDALTRMGVEAEVFAFANRGRDVLPFLKVLARLSLDGTRVLLKLHTKRTEHRSDGDQWRTDLLETLASPRRATRLLEALERDGGPGAIAPDAHALPLSDYVGANASNVVRLADRMGLGRVTESRFIAGSMFWARIDALRPLLEMDLCDWEFDEEAGQTDGTLAHAIERMVALAVAHRDMRTVEANALLGEPASITFNYAARNVSPTVP